MPVFDDFVLPRQFLRMCRRNLWRTKIVDSSGLEFSGGGLLTAALALRRLLRREVLAAGEVHAGILLPPSAGAVLANAALAIDRRIPVNLNYTVTSDVLNASLTQCGIRHVLTSRRMLERFPLKLDAELVYLEELGELATRFDKLLAATTAWLLPAFLLERLLGLTSLRPDDLATVIFTSGSTGQPKGVMLTHANLAANLKSFNGRVDFRPSDALLGVLPMFHAFGFTATLWTVLTLDPKGVYHYSPLEARQIGALCRKHRCTFLVATPTFLNAYLRRCEPDDLRSLEVVVAGAEKLPSDLADAFQERFGVLPIEGYGTTELSPVVSVNRPPTRAGKGDSPHLPTRGYTGAPRPGGCFAQMGTVPFSGCGNRRGTVGQPLPGIDVKVVDVDTGDDLPPGRQGMLLVRGPSVMKGYLNRPDLTAEVMRGEWYVTGDLAVIDAENYISITGRLSRFSKIGGEMVPHLRVEEAIRAALADDAVEVQLAVTAVHDRTRGERLIVLHTGLGIPPADVCRHLLAHGIPPLWIPSPDSFRQVASIPQLGTGKLDLSGLKELAAGLYGGTAGERSGS
jgi:acyl-[acyl-carrier-protein]-phospholipid O-acyltransferase / long-chain-fatty-acid--[acyl-carrier-protein] ligase